MAMIAAAVVRARTNPQRSLVVRLPGRGNHPTRPAARAHERSHGRPKRGPPARLWRGGLHITAVGLGAWAARAGRLGLSREVNFNTMPATV